VCGGIDIGREGEVSAPTDRFSQPTEDLRDIEWEQEIEAAKADEFQDSKVDRE
jgi:hypothetical protein